MALTTASRTRPLGSFPTEIDGDNAHLHQVQHENPRNGTVKLKKAHSRNSISTEESESTQDMIELFAELDAFMDYFNERAKSEKYNDDDTAETDDDDDNDGFFFFNDEDWNNFPETTFQPGCESFARKRKSLSKVIRQGVKSVLHALPTCDGRAAWELERDVLLEELQRERIKVIALEQENEELLAYTGRAEF